MCPIECQNLFKLSNSCPRGVKYGTFINGWCEGSGLSVFLSSTILKGITFSVTEFTTTITDFFYNNGYSCQLYMTEKNIHNELILFILSLCPYIQVCIMITY